MARAVTLIGLGKKEKLADKSKNKCTPVKVFSRVEDRDLVVCSEDIPAEVPASQGAASTWKRQVDGSYYHAAKHVLVFKKRPLGKLMRCAYHFPSGREKCARTVKKAKELF